MKRLAFILLFSVTTIEAQDTCIVVGLTEGGVPYQVEMVQMRSGLSSPWKVGMIYVEFTDQQKITTASRPNGFLVTDYDSALNSTSGYWYDDTPPTVHPDNRRMRGSVREYWREVSNNNWDFDFRMVNAKESTAQYQRPLWYLMPQTMDFYRTTPGGYGILFNDAINGMFTLGRLDSINQYDSYSIIVPGSLQNIALGGRWTTDSGCVSGTITGDRATGSFDIEKQLIHETGHAVFSFTDHRSILLSDLGGFDIMGYGNYNTDATTLEEENNVSASFPSTTNPHYRAKLGWQTATEITNGQVQLRIKYGELYKIVTNKGNLLYLEKRRSQIMKRDVLPRRSQNNLLVWRSSFDCDFGQSPLPVCNFYNACRIEVLKADGQGISGSRFNFVFPYDTNSYFPRAGSTTQDFTPSTLPALLNADGSSAGVALKGIRRLDDSTAIIDTVKLYPSAVTLMATNITGNSASLHGVFTANFENTTAKIYWGKTPDNDPFSEPTTWDSMTVRNLMNNLPLQIDTTVGGLSRNWWYYVYTKATSALGQSTGDTKLFKTDTTSVSPPTVTTQAATLVTVSSARLNGVVNANGSTTTALFKWGTLPTVLPNSIPVVQNPIGGTSNTSVHADLTGLVYNTTYYFALQASNVGGTTYGDTLSFTTPTGRPFVVSITADEITTTSARLSSSFVDSGSTITAYRYVWGTSSGVYTDSVLVSNPYSTTTLTITGLTASTTYYWRPRAYNANGAGQGAERSFTTLSSPSQVTTFPALMGKQP